MKKNRYALLLLTLVMAIMALFGCSAGTEPATKQGTQDLYAIGTCTTDAQCQGLSALTVGYCSAPSLAVCASDHYCSFAVDVSNTACQCINGDERQCATGGYQTCFLSGSGTAWTTCDTSYDGLLSFTAPDSCNGDVDCADNSHAPACSSYWTNQCRTATHQCLWSLLDTADEPDCACVEHSVRDCTKAGGGHGHQSCYLVTGTSSSNDWGHPTAWNTCS